MDIGEGARPVTIKAQTVRLKYHARTARINILNLMDHPRPRDFAYEVNRSLAAC